ncbi:MAG TPA: DUF2341 domain-containing protein [Polyangiaceae bacterium]
MRSIAFALLVSACGLFPDLGGLSSSDAGENPDVKNDALVLPTDGGSDVVTAPDADPDAMVTYARTITIKNNASQSLPKGYTIGVAFSESALQAAITAGKMRSDMNDLRVRGTSGQRDRLVDAPPLSRVVWFSLASPISANATDTTYEITYGVPNAASPPSDGSNVFDFYDDFSGTTIDSQWMTQGTANVGSGVLTLPHGGLGALTTVSQAPTSTAEWRAQITDPTSNPDPNTGFYYWFGFQHTGDFDADQPWIIWIARAASSVGAEDAADGCTSVCGNTPLSQSNQFRYYAIERQPTQTIFSIDLAPSYTTAATNDQAQSLMIRSYLQTSDLVVDWFRSRVRIYPEPTVTLGPEQQQ